jgi:hypothetical protein
VQAEQSALEGAANKEAASEERLPKVLQGLEKAFA